MKFLLPSIIGLFFILPGYLLELRVLNFFDLFNTEKFAGKESLLYLNQNKDTLILKATEYSDIGYCARLENIYRQEECYFHVSLKLASNEGLSLVEKKNFCPFIRNPVLRKICKRCLFRPHLFNLMRQFKLNPETDPDLFKRCSIFKKEEHALCLIYSFFMNLNKLKPGGKDSCKNLEENLKSPCLYYFLSDFIIEIKEIKSNFSIELAKEYCNKMEEPRWKSECYFLLADQLNSMEDKVFWPDIINLCLTSGNFHIFGCLEKSLFFIKEADLSLSFCDLAREKSEKNHWLKCYEKIGLNISDKNSSKSNFNMDFCQKIKNPDGVLACKEGLKKTKGR